MGSPPENLHHVVGRLGIDARRLLGAKDFGMAKDVMDIAVTADDEESYTRNLIDRRTVTHRAIKGVWVCHVLWRKWIKVRR